MFIWKFVHGKLNKQNYNKFYYQILFFTDILRNLKMTS